MITQHANATMHSNKDIAQHRHLILHGEFQTAVHGKTSEPK